MRTTLLPLLVFLTSSPMKSTLSLLASLPRPRSRAASSLLNLKSKFLPPYTVPASFSYPHAIPIEGSDATLTVKYTDYRSVVVVSKPVGVTSAPGGAGEDVVTAVCREFGVFDVSRAVAHRLDMETSGLLMVALTPEAQKWLYEDFREKRIQKTYEALVVGEVGAERGEGSVKSAKDMSNTHSGPWQDVVDEGYLRRLQIQIEGD